MDSTPSESVVESAVKSVAESAGLLKKSEADPSDF